MAYDWVSVGLYRNRRATLLLCNTEKCKGVHHNAVVKYNIWNKINFTSTINIKTFNIGRVIRSFETWTTADS